MPSYSSIENLYLLIEGAVRAEMAVPPGFSATTRAPPPGFSSQNRFNQAYEMTNSGLYILLSYYFTVITFALLKS